MACANTKLYPYKQLFYENQFVSGKIQLQRDHLEELMKTSGYIKNGKEDDEGNAYYANTVLASFAHF